MSETIQVHVNTADLKSDGNGLYEIKTGLVGIKSYKIVSIELPDIGYYIGASNNEIKFKEGGVGAPTQTATIVIGNYSISGLISAIQNAMNTASSGYTVGYNSVTGKILFTKSSGVFGLILSGSSAASVIGLSADTVFGNPVMMQNVYNLLPYNYVFLQSAELNALKSRKNVYYGHPGITDVIYKIPVGTKLLVNESEVRGVLKQSINIDKFTFKIIDPSGNRVIFTGGNYSFSINFYK